MKNILSDCPFAVPIMELPQPRRLLLLGSGITKAPKSWLQIPGIEVVMFNNRSLLSEYYKDVQIYAVVCWKKTLPYCERDCAIAGKQPFFIVLDDHIEPLIDLSRKRLVFDDGHREKEKYVGRWYANISRDISHHWGSNKIYTTGFYMTLWLLAGSQEEIYIAGFDGYQQNRLIRHLNDSTPLPFNNKSHDYNFEWRYIEIAIKVARERGIKVSLATENSL